MKNEQIIKNFLNGNAASFRHKALTTDGETLYSYHQKIATHTDDGYIIFDFTAKGGHSISNTTSTHVGLVKRMAPSYSTTIMRPDAAKVAGLI